MTPKVLREIVKDAAARAGIERLAPHDLRRYADSRTMPRAVPRPSDDEPASGEVSFGDGRLRPRGGLATSRAQSRDTDFLLVQFFDFGYFFANLPQLGRHPILRRMVWRASLSSESSCRMIRTSKECYAEEDRSPEQEDVRCGHSNAHGHRCEGGRQFLSLGLRFRQTRNYERARRQTDTRRVAAARYDSDAGAGDPAAWCPKRQGNRRFAGNLVPDGGERRSEEHTSELQL